MHALSLAKLALQPVAFALGLKTVARPHAHFQEQMEKCEQQAVKA